MKRGPYKEYTRNPNKSIPDTTKRSREKRARLLEEARSPDSSDEDSENQSPRHDNDPIIGNFMHGAPTGAIHGASTGAMHSTPTGAMSDPPVNNQDSSNESGSESDRSDEDGPSLTEFIFSDEETERFQTFSAAPDPVFSEVYMITSIPLCFIPLFRASHTIYG
ncbi:hypothetical protein QAD02_003333 [Eretmocerus hayati]|uniref:Uncharacterized protein n=1 Tax=Eretmocerus hayati TaxID=131215 RepID=A0ACC2NLU8_9HYME|nr:hypothetical protein QAD02_003333 [Eretmocerus hayati]